MLAILRKIKSLFILLLTTGVLLSASIRNAYAVYDLETLRVAYTIFREIGGAANNESIQLVANVITNRVNEFRKKDPSITFSDVIFQKSQFLGAPSPNASSTQLYNYLQKKAGSKFNLIINFAVKAMNGTLKDISHGSTGFNRSKKRLPGETTLVADEHCLYKKGSTNCGNKGGHGNGKVDHYFFKAKGLSVPKHKASYGSGSDNLPENYQGGTDVIGDDSGAMGDMSAASTEVREEPPYVEPSECAAAIDSSSTLLDDNLNSKTMFADDILMNMKSMMVKINQSLGALSMLGQGLRCYSWDIAPLEISAEPIQLRIIRMNFYIPGMFIGLTAFFLSMAIGMYFIDISFKLGFAVVFLPLSLSLWPFPPTKDKFIENISIVIRNAMLFACISIGISYAIILISEGILSEGWEDFWTIVDDRLQLAEESDKYNDNMQRFTESFSIDTTRVLIIIFCLFFAFKIVSSSVTAYLNRFFGEGALGSAENAMHHMGTQAMGTITNATVGNAGRLARDIAVTQAGRGMKALGNKVTKNPINSKFGGGTSAAGATKGGGENPQNPAPKQGGIPKQGGKNQDTIPNQDGVPNQGGKNQDTVPNQDGVPNQGGKNQDTVPNQDGVPNQGGKNQDTIPSGNTGSGSQNQENLDGLKSADIKPATTAEKINEFTRPTGHSLTVGNMFKAMRHPQQTYRTVKQLAKQGSKDWKEADGVKGKSKLIFKKSGQIALRSIRGNMTEGAATTQKVLGKVLTGFGSYLEKKPAQWQKAREDSRKRRPDINYDTSGRDRNREKELGMTNDEDY